MTAIRGKQYHYLPAVVTGVVLLSGATLVQGRETERVSVSSLGVRGNNDSFRPALSANGRFVAFASVSTNLVRGQYKGRP